MLFMKEVQLSISIFFVFVFLSLSDLLCLRSSRSKYNASTINYLLVFSTLRPKIRTDMNNRIVNMCYRCKFPILM